MGANFNMFILNNEFMIKKMNIQKHIDKYGYGIAKARYGLQSLKKYDLLSPLDKALESQK